MYGYDISNEVSPKVVSTSVQQNWMRSHDLTKLKLIKNFPAKTSHKTENQIFHQKFNFGTTILYSVAYVRNQRILSEY